MAVQAALKQHETLVTQQAQQAYVETNALIYKSQGNKQIMDADAAWDSAIQLPFFRVISFFINLTRERFKHPVGIPFVLRIVNRPVYAQDPATLIGKIAPYCKRGRLLIANPGGNCTAVPVCWMLGSLDDANVDHGLDFGHVAIITKNANTIYSEWRDWGKEQGDKKDPKEIFGGYKMSVSIDPKYDVWREGFRYAWAEKHAWCHIGQIFKRVWHWKKKCERVCVSVLGWKKCWDACVPYYWYDDYDVNESIAQGAEDWVNRNSAQYASAAQLLFVKWAAPSKFICSSLPWYITKTREDENISNWWTPTIFPSGCYESDRIRIIYSTRP